MVPPGRGGPTLGRACPRANCLGWSLSGGHSWFGRGWHGRARGGARARGAPRRPRTSPLRGKPQGGCRAPLRCLSLPGQRPPPAAFPHPGPLRGAGGGWGAGGARWQGWPLPSAGRSLDRGPFGDSAQPMDGPGERTGGGRGLWPLGLRHSDLSHAESPAQLKHIIRRRKGKQRRMPQ